MLVLHTIDVSEDSIVKFYQHGTGDVNCNRRIVLGWKVPPTVPNLDPAPNQNVIETDVLK